MCAVGIGVRAMLDICLPAQMNGLPGDEALTPQTGLGLPCIGRRQQRNIFPAPRAPDELTDSRICHQKIESVDTVASDLH